MPKEVIGISFDSDLIIEMTKAGQRAGQSRSAWVNHIMSILLPFDAMLVSRFVLTQYGERTAQELVAELVRQMEKK